MFSFRSILVQVWPSAPINLVTSKLKFPRCQCQSLLLPFWHGYRKLSLTLYIHYSWIIAVLTTKLVIFAAAHCALDYKTLIPWLIRDAWINSERSEGFWAARKISQRTRCYNSRRIIYGVMERISDDLSTVLWPNQHDPETGVLAEIMSRRMLWY